MDGFLGIFCEEEGWEVSGFFRDFVRALRRGWAKGLESGWLLGYLE